MKYMAVWSIAPENAEAAYKRFKEANPKPGTGVKVLGRWHEMGTGKGFTLLEADNPVEMSKLSIEWADLVDKKVVPVIDDEEMGKALSG